MLAADSITWLRKKKLRRILRHSFLDQASLQQKPLEGNSMKWETPAYNDMRFGFEVTMYIYNR
jgi:pyrroloquinoline quinone biosynthesis protein A